MVVLSRCAIPWFFLICILGQPPLAALLLAVTLGIWYAVRAPPATSKFREMTAPAQPSARAIARIYGACAVVFGHSHTAYGRWVDGVFYGNSGTWGPYDTTAALAAECSRPAIWLRAGGTGLSGGLYRFYQGELHPEAGRLAEAELPAAPAAPHHRLSPQAELEAVRLLM